MIKISEIYQLINDIAVNHYQLKTVFIGTPQQAMAKDVALDYPALIVSVGNVTYNKLSKNVVINLLFIDKLESGERNVLHLENSLELIANDFYKIITTPLYKAKLAVNSAVSTKIADRMKDDVIGWLLSIDALVHDDVCIFDLPFDEDFLNTLMIVPSSGGGGTSIVTIGCSINGNYNLIPIGIIAQTLGIAGTVQFWSIWSNIGDGQYTMTVDVLKNGSSMIGTGTKPYLLNENIRRNSCDWTDKAIATNDAITFVVDGNENVTNFTIRLEIKAQ